MGVTHDGGRGTIQFGANRRRDTSLGHKACVIVNPVPSSDAIHRAARDPGRMRPGLHTTGYTPGPELHRLQWHGGNTYFASNDAVSSSNEIAMSLSHHNRNLEHES